MEIEKLTAAECNSEASGPAWDIETEYPGLSSNEFIHDMAVADGLVTSLVAAVRGLKPTLRALLADPTETAPETAPETAIDRSELAVQLQAISEMRDQTEILYANLGTFVGCVQDVNGKDDEAFKLRGLLNNRKASLRAELKPVELFLTLAPEDFLQLYLAHPHTAPEAHQLKRKRLMAATRLSEAEETLLERLRPHGPEAFGALYDQISARLNCQVVQPNHAPDAASKVAVEEMGLAQAAGLLRDRSEPLRRAAWHGIQAAWQPHQESGAAVLNGLAGWRIEEYRQRSRLKPLGFLDVAVHRAGIELPTLNAMMQATQEAIPVGRRAMKAMAKTIGKSALDPWDLLAAAPQLPGSDQPANLWTFREALHLIRDAFAAVHPEFGDFVDTMEKNRWIEARVMPNKRQGAYCTRFAKSRTPRVFQTFMGSLPDVRTLAHELGHAYHAWVTRDLASAELAYPMTLAETASLFAETALSDHLNSLGEKVAFEVGWGEAQSTASHILNIPARFTFERSFYEARQTSQFTTAKELGDLTEQAWKEWHGDSITQADRLFWISKLHFSMSRVSFYNFPYTFGALFALSIYARKSELGAEFMPSYIALLRDTGRMSAEELARKHLNEDISQPQFWKMSLAFLDSQLEHFEDLSAKRSAKLDV